MDIKPAKAKPITDRNRKLWTYLAAGRVSRLQLVFGLGYSLSIFFFMAFIISIASAVHILPSHPTGLAKGAYSVVYITLYIAGTILFAVSSTSLVVRRWHDLNKSGWWAITHVIPILDIMVLVYLLSAKTVEPNRFGPSSSTTSYLVLLGFKPQPKSATPIEVPTDYQPPQDDEPFDN